MSIKAANSKYQISKYKGIFIGKLCSGNIVQWQYWDVILGIFTYFWQMFIVNLGKYTSAMDGMGNANRSYHDLLTPQRPSPLPKLHQVAGGFSFGSL